MSICDCKTKNYRVSDEKYIDDDGTIQIRLRCCDCSGKVGYYPADQNFLSHLKSEVEDYNRTHKKTGDLKWN